MRAVRWILVLAAPFALALTGCAPERAEIPPFDLVQTTTTTNEAPAPRPVAPRARVELPEDVSADVTANRDPFQAYKVEPLPPPTDLRPRKSRRFGVEQLKLAGLVTGTSTPRAMLVDPTGRGVVVTQGELVGKPEVVRRAGQDGYLASWRVDRIRAGDVVLVREDAGDPDAAPATRTLSMPAEPLLATQDD
jgi:type IV pilus assembly protein PilP